MAANDGSSVTSLDRQAAHSYLAELGVTGKLQTCLNDLCRERPRDPYAYLLESMVPLCLAPEVTKVTAVECFNDQLLPVFDAFVHCIHRGSTVQCGHASVGDSESWEQDAAAEGEECTPRLAQAAAAFAGGALTASVAGTNPKDQAAVDKLLDETERGETSERAAKMAVLGVSLANLAAGAFVSNVDGHSWLRTLTETVADPRIPQIVLPLLECAEGSKVLFTKFWIASGKGLPVADAVHKLKKFQQAIKGSLSKKAPVPTNVEGAAVFKFDKVEQPFDLVMDAFKATDLVPGTDVELLFKSELVYNEEKLKYDFMVGQQKTAEECVDAYKELVAKYPAVKGIIDPFNIEHGASWKLLQAALGDTCFVAGGSSSCPGGIADLAPKALAEEPEAENPDPKDAGDAGAEAEAGKVDGSLIASAIQISVYAHNTVSKLIALADAAEQQSIKTFVALPPCNSTAAATYANVVAGLEIDYVCMRGFQGCGASAVINRFIELSI